MKRKSIKKNGNGGFGKDLALTLLNRARIKNYQSPSFVLKEVIKSTGKKEKFDLRKLEKSIVLAGRDVGEYGKKQAAALLRKAILVIASLEKSTLTTNKLRDIVEPLMAAEGFFKTARYYILYKERKSNAQGPTKIKEPVMTPYAKLTLVSRCSKQDVNGKYIETPGEIFLRVARHIAKAEVNWGGEQEVERATRLFYDKMVDFKFICTRSALYEAGNEACSQQLSPCFVLPVEDSISGLFKTLGEAALVHKNFGGTGFNFSKVRMKGDKARNVPNAASGPVDFLQVYSAALTKVVQGAKRHGGNMGILNVDHPDIYDFISAKDEDGNMKNFNISVGVTNDFMEAVVADKDFELKNPRDGRIVRTVSARKLFEDICKHAWATGDPGMIFLDRMEEDNFTPTLGKLDATNPCGEQPLLPYETCNLSSVHLARHLVKKGKGWEMNWEELGSTVRSLVRFLDDMIEVNFYVLPETERNVKLGNRKIGLGMIGFAEVLFRLGISYNSKEAVRMAEKIGKFIKSQAEEASLELAKTRGVFPNWDISTYKGSSERYRNCTMITIAPTGTVSMIGNTTSGIEPSFALVYTRSSFYNEDADNRSTRSLLYVDPCFQETLKDMGLYTKEILNKVTENHGSVQNVKELPNELRRVFVTTHDIDPEWHVRIQAAFQKYADNSVSKTINFRASATPQDVERAYMLAWKLGCKGITIYRDGSKEDQVLSTGNGKKLHTTKKPVVDIYNGRSQKECPECGGKLEHEAGCVTCRDCGWSKCII